MSRKKIENIRRDDTRPREIPLQPATGMSIVKLEPRSVNSRNLSHHRLIPPLNDPILNIALRRMSSPDRQELLRNAVVFLQDPKVVPPSFIYWHPVHISQTQASPFAQRIQFLEAKGLTPQEIDIAIKQSSSSTQSPNHQPAFVANYSQTLYPPGAQRWDWRDYFASLFHPAWRTRIHPAYARLLLLYLVHSPMVPYLCSKCVVCFFFF